ncbi:Spc98 family-domain-containing protein [Pisolithus orientalis]|uniref:Spc98 family-domain-containing protein n=1 Tax=Pisolithus orientalis TaxID=936130 RepID=UPI0022242457|nr:Spc98 family-domain-containing protein [Pisolithus orientalis]KAI6033056.1 Spc98 family-domain-containing protein [Pisolithus orientalis]
MTLCSIDRESKRRKVVFPLSALPPILPQFSIPLLDDRPQDPIAQTSSFQWTTGNGATDRDHYNEACYLSRDEFLSHAIQDDGQIPLWNRALVHPRSAYQIMSWDGILPPQIAGILKMPFLTEQPLPQFGLVQQHVLSDTTVCQPPDDLVMSLRLLVLGSSSRLYVWNNSLELFVHQSPSKVGSKAILVGRGNRFISKDYLQRFLDLGSLIRRMELLAYDLRDRGSHTDPSIHAFAHGLSTLLSFWRDQLSRGPLFGSDDVLYPADFAAIWLHYAEEEQTISSIATMCHRSLEISPENYFDLSTNPVDLLSRIYQALEQNVEVVSPRQVIAAIAYMLTVSSTPYITSLCKSVAYREGGPRYSWISEELSRPDPFEPYDGGDSAGTWQRNFLDAEHVFPKFVPASLADVLPIARKSLRLLGAVQPDHWILSQGGALQTISWLWSEVKIHQAWGDSHYLKSSPALPVKGCPTASVTDNHNSVLDEFKVFDMEPRALSAEELGHCDSHPAIADFMATFPESLPLIIPNLSLLCDLVFSPLESHASLLSRAFLSVFLNESSFLCVDAHLTLLRSHLLLTSHTFKSRLAEALFSDTYGREDLCGAAKAFDSLRRQPQTVHTSAFPPTNKLAIGLAPALTARDSWPPGGSDLSFLLRTVIVDAQEYGRRHNRRPKSSPAGILHVLDEAEFRLGFAVRDLPVGTGRERWLNPLSIEALDFLYLDYKVPHPMEVLIPQTVLSKYQRIFSFLLRLMRVEAAIRSVYRLTCLLPRPSLSKFPLCSKLVWQFRFAADYFVSALLTYVYDVAIGSNFDAFLSQIAACREHMASNKPHEFPDVFTLSEFHSSVLNDILSACLLRSSQRTAGDILRGAMELVLEFCVLVTDLDTAESEVHKIDSALRTLYAAFREKVVTLLEELDALLEKDARFLQETNPLPLGMEAECHVPPGGTASLRYLLARLDLSNWWRSLD